MNYNILIIDDETETSRFLSLALQKEGFDVVCAENGFSGLEILKQKEFDMVVLDLKMPRMSGDKVLKEIRNISAYLQVIVYTNYSDANIMAKLINLGVDGFIKKGAEADLWGAVEIIKSKFQPIDDANRKMLLNKLFEQFPTSFENEIPA